MKCNVSIAVHYYFRPLTVYELGDETVNFHETGNSIFTNHNNFTKISLSVIKLSFMCIRATCSIINYLRCTV